MNKPSATQGPFGAGEPERHAYCPDEDKRCQHGDDENCPKLRATPLIVAGRVAHKFRKEME